jgi:hypothetical protein
MFPFIGPNTFVCRLDAFFRYYLCHPHGLAPQFSN